MLHPFDQLKIQAEPAKDDSAAQLISFAVLAAGLFMLLRKPEEKLVGGIGDFRKPEEFDLDEFSEGQRVEMEHTDDPEIAKEIAVDHLNEDPEYYSKLKTIEGHNPEQSYHGEHKAPDRESGSPLYDVTLNGIYPSDFYSADGFRYYCDYGDKRDYFNYSLVVQYKDRPKARVEVYRAVPKSLSRSSKSINPGDWVTLSKSYAVEHGQSALNNDYSILTKTVRARDLFTAGDSILEWGYDPQVSGQSSDESGQ
jgi:hypothetical protein